MYLYYFLDMSIWSFRKLYHCVKVLMTDFLNFSYLLMLDDSTWVESAIVYLGTLFLFHSCISNLHVFPTISKQVHLNLFPFTIFFLNCRCFSASNLITFTKVSNFLVATLLWALIVYFFYPLVSGPAYAHFD